MAEREKKQEQPPAPQGSDRDEKPGGIIQSIVVVLLALLVVFAVSAGVFYFTVKNNIGGMADLLRPRIGNHPILKLALPAVPVVDPDDPKNLTSDELLKKYNSYRKRVRELDEQLAKANDTIDKLQEEAKATTDAAVSLEENRKLLETIRQEQQKLEKEKAELFRLLAMGDTEGFKDYFQKIDKAAAEALYKDILTEEALDRDKEALAKPFSVMEPASAGSVLSELYSKDKDTVLDIFEGLKPNAAALILENMEAAVAADITKMLSDRKLGQ